MWRTASQSCILIGHHTATSWPANQRAPIHPSVRHSRWRRSGSSTGGRTGSSCNRTDHTLRPRWISRFRLDRRCSRCWERTGTHCKPLKWKRQQLMWRHSVDDLKLVKCHAYVSRLCFSFLFLEVRLFLSLRTLGLLASTARPVLTHSAVLKVRWRHNRLQSWHWGRQPGTYEHILNKSCTSFVGAWCGEPWLKAET